MTTNEEPTDHERFVSDAHKRAHLKALLADPVLQEAMNIADDLMRPRTNTPADANQPLTVAKFHQSAGANEFVRQLNGMTRERKEVIKPTPRRFAKTEDDLPKTD
jgi:hypothetical protein